MEFWKMNGAGNDFIIINNFKGNIPAEKFPYIAETLCERHLSIGADGFMVVAQPSEEYKDKADFKMLFFNLNLLIYFRFQIHSFILIIVRRT